MIYWLWDVGANLISHSFKPASCWKHNARHAFSPHRTCARYVVGKPPAVGGLSNSNHHHCIELSIQRDFWCFLMRAMFVDIMKVSNKQSSFHILRRQFYLVFFWRIFNGRLKRQISGHIPQAFQLIAPAISQSLSFRPYDNISAAFNWSWKRSCRLTVSIAHSNTFGLTKRKTIPAPPISTAASHRPTPVGCKTTRSIQTRVNMEYTYPIIEHSTSTLKYGQKGIAIAINNTSHIKWETLYHVLKRRKTVSVPRRCARIPLKGGTHTHTRARGRNAQRLKWDTIKIVWRDDVPNGRQKIERKMCFTLFGIVAFACIQWATKNYINTHNGNGLMASTKHTSAHTTCIRYFKRIERMLNHLNEMKDQQQQQLEIGWYVLFVCP